MGFVFAGLLAAAILLIAIVGIRKIVTVRRLIAPPAAAYADAAAFDDIAVGAPYRLARSRHGWILVNPNDVYLGQAILRYGECCEIEVRFLLQLIAMRPGLVLEIGANIGTHTVPLATALASQGRRMVVFEPQPIIFQNLCANLALNGLVNVVAWPNACADQPSTLYFPWPDYSSKGNFGGISMSEEPLSDGYAVPCVTVDGVVGNEAVCLMKIDVEGFELAVLRGAEASLDGSRPVIYVENDRVEKSRALIEWLWSKNYRLWWHLTPLFNPENQRANQDNFYGEVVSINMLCLPRESEIPVVGLEEIVSSTWHPTNPTPQAAPAAPANRTAHDGQTSNAR